MDINRQTFNMDVKSISRSIEHLKSVKKDWAILGSSGSIAAIGATAYYLAKHLVYVSKRNQFYRQHNLIIKEKRRNRKKEKQNSDT